MALPGFPQRDRPARARVALAFNSIPAPLDDLRGRAKLQPGHLLLVDADGEREAAPLRAAAPGRRSGRGASGAGELATSCASACATRCARTWSPTCRSACCSRAGSTRGARGAGRAGERRARAARSRSASRSARSTSSSARASSRERYDTDHHELIVRPDAVGAAAAAGGGVRRAVRRLVGPAHLPGLAARRRARQGGALGRGRRRAVRRLLHLRRRHARARASAGSPRALRPLIERLPSSSAQVSFDYKAKRFARGGALPPLERHHAWKEIFSPEARAELLRRPPRRRLRPARRVPRALRGDRGRGAARAAPGRGPRHLPRRRPAREDRPRQHGALARGARAVPRHGGHRARAGAAAAAERARLREEAAAAPGGRAAPAAARSSTGASAASRSRRPRGCAASCEPFARDVLSPDALARQGCSGPRRWSACSTRTRRGREDHSRQIWGLMTFSLWHERYGVGAAARRQRHFDPLPGLSDCDADLSRLPRLCAGAGRRLDRDAGREPLAWRIGAIDTPRERGLHQFPTPRLGGLAILAGGRWPPRCLPAARTSRRAGSSAARP